MFNSQYSMSRRAGAAAFWARLPDRDVLRLGKTLGMLTYLADSFHRRIVQRNIRFAFPEWSFKDARMLGKRMFQQLGITLLETIQTAYLSREQIIGKFGPVEGRQHVIEALNRGKGIVIVSAHLGSWELALQFFNCYFQTPVLGVVKKMHSEFVERWVYGMRTRLGNQILYKKNALPEISQTLRRGGVTGLLIDMSRRKDGVEVEFFGKRATATPAAALMGIRYKSPVIPAFCIRKPDGRLTFQIEPPIQIQKSGDLRVDFQVNTQLMTDVVERMVREHPEQWFWLQRRWKDFYPHLYPDSEGRRFAKKKKNSRYRRPA
jgi:KDO2-lipid IV(A) lauroyltransferase